MAPVIEEWYCDGVTVKEHSRGEAGAYEDDLGRQTGKHHQLSELECILWTLKPSSRSSLWGRWAGIDSECLGRRTNLLPCQTLFVVILSVVGGLHFSGATTTNATAGTALVSRRTEVWRKLC